MKMNKSKKNEDEKDVWCEIIRKRHGCKPLKWYGHRG